MDNDNFINPGTNWPDDHYYKNDMHDGSYVDLTFGYALTRYCDWLPAIMFGLNYTYAFQGKVSGYINQYNLGQFQNYTYSYDFSRQSLMGIAKLDIWRGPKNVMPYFIVGTGASFNKGSSYSEQPLANVTPRISPGYSTGTHTSWAYMLGAGIDYAFRDDIWVGLEYNYSDFGTVQTGNGEPTKSLTGMNYSGRTCQIHLRANSVALNFT